MSKGKVELKRIVFVVLLLLLSGCTTQTADYPTKAGSYERRGWKYVYTIEYEGTRSEKRIGKLYRNGAEVIGNVGEIRETQVGTFVFFSLKGYSQGWLNTLTYDRPVFQNDGRLLPEVKATLENYSDASGK